MAKSPVYFPIVGLLMGAALAATGTVVVHLFPSFLAAVLITIFLIAFSGGLHLDGLSDTADGFLSSRSRERVLEIMKDSHIGAMGVVAIGSVLFLKIASLASIPKHAVWQTALLMPLTGRSALVISMAVLPYARPEGGLGSLFYKHRPKTAAIFALALLLAAGWFTCSWPGLVATGASVAAVLIFSVMCSLKTGGATGDTLGAACEIAETIFALAMAAWHYSAGGTP